MPPGFSCGFWQSAEYLSGYTAVIPAFLLFRKEAGENKRQRKFIGFLIILNIAGAVVLSVMNTIKTVNWAVLRAGYVLLLTDCACMTLFTFDTVCKNGVKDFVLRTGVIIFLYTCVCDIAISELSAQNTYPALISEGAVYFAFSLSFSNIVKIFRESERNRVRAAAGQMPLHFLFNVLSAIRTVVKIDPDYAYRLLYDFSVCLRGNIRALQSDELIPFTDELKNTEAYLNIEKMRMGDWLNVEYDIQCTDFRVIPLSVETLAENAAKHGIYPLGNVGGSVTVISRETADSYVIQVVDDGGGFDVNKALKTENGSVGLKNLIFIMKTLMNAEVRIESEIGSGTIATIIIHKGRNK